MASIENKIIVGETVSMEITSTFVIERSRKKSECKNASNVVFDVDLYDKQVTKFERKLSKLCKRFGYTMYRNTLGKGIDNG